MGLAERRRLRRPPQERVPPGRRLGGDEQQPRVGGTGGELGPDGCRLLAEPLAGAAPEALGGEEAGGWFGGVEVSGDGGASYAQAA